MKNRFSSYLALFGAIALVGLLMAAVSPSVARYATSADKVQILSWPLDSITNTAADTLLFSGIQTSKWNAAIHVDGKQISGTQVLVAQLQGSGFALPDADQWKEIARDTCNGALEQVFIDAGELDLVNYRIILTGVGTMVAEYEVVVNLKKD